MATMPESTARRPHFFKVLLPGSSERLKIPPAFVRHIEGDRMPQKAMILNPLGRIFHVTIEEDMENLFFGAGWQQFVDAHDLDLWYFLMFRYEGHLIFSVRVFDLTGCEKEYGPMERDDMNHGRIDRCSPKSSSNVTEGIHRTPTRSCKNNAAEELRLQLEVSKRTAMDLNPVMAKKAASRSTNTCEKFPCFKAVITAYNRTTCVYLPVAFKTQNKISRKEGQMVLRDPGGRLWTVSLSHISRNRTVLRRGWKKFSVSNNLKVGDECTFELLPDRRQRSRILQVHIKSNRGRRTLPA